MRLILFVTISMLLSSCGTYRFNKTSDFGIISDLSELNGTYRNEPQISKKGWEIGMIRLFFSTKEIVAYNAGNNEMMAYNIDIDLVAIRKEIEQIMDTVTLRFLDNNTLLVSCLINETVFSKEFKGKKKKKYFEIYYKKEKLIIPLIYSNIDVYRLRIGRYKKTNDLLIRNLSESSVSILFIGVAADAGERPYVYKRIVEN